MSITNITMGRKSTLLGYASVLAATSLIMAGCHLSDVLKVPEPLGVENSQGIQSQTGAEQVFNGARQQIYGALYYGGDLVMYTSLLSDEMRWSEYKYFSYGANIDARSTQGGAYPGPQESGDYPWESLLQEREQMILAEPLLEKYETAGGQSKIGEAFALTAYDELFLAESYCDGTPLDHVLFGGGFAYGMPLSDDSILSLAAVDFDSALAHAAGNDTITNLASVGMGRVLMDRGQYAAAATAVASVPANFVYNAQFEPGACCTSPYVYNMYDNDYYGGFSQWNMSDVEGTNGLNFISANDPRLQVDSTEAFPSYATGTSDGGKLYMPKKFEVNLGLVSMSTGIEAALIQAEAALANNDPATWLTDLNTLRNGNTACVDHTNATCAVGSASVPGQATGLYSLTDPGTDTGRVNLMFRERAFWLYGTGTRLGDLRRLVRQYGTKYPNAYTANTVYPTGAYEPAFQSLINGISLPTYGNDVVLTLPTQANIKNGFSETNPNFKGCTTPTTTA